MDSGKFSNLFPSGEIGKTGQPAASQEMSQPHIWILRPWESLSADWGWPGQRVHAGAVARLSALAVLLQPGAAPGATAGPGQAGHLKITILRPGVRGCDGQVLG